LRAPIVALIKGRGSIPLVTSSYSPKIMVSKMGVRLELGIIFLKFVGVRDIPTTKLLGEKIKFAVMKGVLSTLSKLSLIWKVATGTRSSSLRWPVAIVCTSPSFGYTSENVLAKWEAFIALKPATLAFFSGLFFVVIKGVCSTRILFP
jgi:hypothetical protein